MTLLLNRWLAADDGQDLVEYTLLGATVAFASIIAISNMGNIMSIVYGTWDASTQAIWEPQPPQPPTP